MSKTEVLSRILKGSWVQRKTYGSQSETQTNYNTSSLAIANSRNLEIQSNFSQPTTAPATTVPAVTDDLGAKPPADKPIASPAKLSTGTNNEVQTGSEVRIGDEIRKGGTVSWRTNNPGNISYTGLAKQFGAIGTWKKADGDLQQRTTGIAIMPTMDAGDALKMNQWRRPMYIDKTIDQGVAQWTGTTGLGSNYAKDLAKAAGVTVDTVIGSLSDSQLKSMVQKQRVWEGFKPGQVVSAADGGSFSGPRSGYRAMLHGTEAVVPLPDGRTIPVTIAGLAEHNERLSQVLSAIETRLGTATGNNGVAVSDTLIKKLDDLIRVASDQLGVSGKILKAQA
jgi:hypothetical protein